MNKTRLNTVLLVTLISISNAEAYILQESFEGSTGYSINFPFDDGAFDFFDRYTVPEPLGGNPARDDFQVGWHGSYGLMGQDFPFDYVAVDIDPVDVTGFTDLTLTVSLGALDDELQGGFDNYELGDGLVIFSCFSGALCESVAEFAPPAAGINTGTEAGDLYLDTDNDGIGDAARLTRALTDYTFPIQGTGNSLTISFLLISTDSFEMIALDNVRISGVPEPSCPVAYALGLLPLLRRYRLRGAAAT